MNDQTKVKGVSLEDLQISVQDVLNKGGFGNIGTCTTAADTAAKTVTLGTIFSLVSGCSLLVKFTNGITSENSTLAITHTTLAGTTTTEAAKPIYLKGAPLEPDVVEAGAFITLYYNGNQFDIVGGAGEGAPNAVLVGDYQGTATYPEFDPMLDTVHTKAQTLTDAKKAQARTNIGAQKIITDLKTLGGGYATCSTEGATAAKTVTFADFLLLPNIPVSVLFTNAFVAADSTLNINDTGAKPIKYYGSNIPNYVVKANTILTLVYDGTNYNVVNVETKPKDDDLWVDLGLPSGVKWARKNIDVTQANGFAASEFQYECTFFSWGNKEGHNPISTSGFDYDFGDNNSGNYASTLGSKLTGNIPLSQDAARIYCGLAWHTPTKEEYQELINNCNFIDESGNVISSSTTDKRTTVNEIVGVYLQSKVNGSRIFIPSVGFGYLSRWDFRGIYGQYSTSSLFSLENSVLFIISSNFVNIDSSTARFLGTAIRPVQ